MHIEPGVVTGAKLIISYAVAGAVVTGTFAANRDSLLREGASVLILRSALTTTFAFISFEIFPHWPVGVSEVHLILGSTLFLLFGAAPAALGLAAGLLIQALFFSPSDLPQYGMNVTSLLAPLLVLNAVADRRIPTDTPYTQLRYRDVLALSLTYQGGVVAWVSFWTVFGSGLTWANFVGIATFTASYVAVLVLESILDLALLSAAKAASGSVHITLAPRVFGESGRPA